MGHAHDLQLEDPVKEICSSQGTNDIVAWQNTVDLQIFSTTSLKFGDIWEKFW